MRIGIYDPTNGDYDDALGVGFSIAKRGVSKKLILDNWLVQYTAEKDELLVLRVTDDYGMAAQWESGNRWRYFSQPPIDFSKLEPSPDTLGEGFFAPVEGRKLYTTYTDFSLVPLDGSSDGTEVYQYGSPITVPVAGWYARISHVRQFIPGFGFDAATPMLLTTYYTYPPSATDTLGLDAFLRFSCYTSGDYITPTVDTVFSGLLTGGVQPNGSIPGVSWVNSNLTTNNILLTAQSGATEYMFNVSVNADKTISLAPSIALDIVGVHTITDLDTYVKLRRNRMSQTFTSERAQYLYQVVYDLVVFQPSLGSAVSLYESIPVSGTVTVRKLRKDTFELIDTYTLSNDTGIKPSYSGSTFTGGDTSSREIMKPFDWDNVLSRMAVASNGYNGFPYNQWFKHWSCYVTSTGDFYVGVNNLSFSSDTDMRLLERDNRDTNFNCFIPLFGTVLVDADGDEHPIFAGHNVTTGNRLQDADRSGTLTTYSVNHYTVEPCFVELIKNKEDFAADKFSDIDIAYDALRLIPKDTKQQVNFRLEEALPTSMDLRWHDKTIPEFCERVTCGAGTSDSFFAVLKPAIQPFYAVGSVALNPDKIPELVVTNHTGAPTELSSYIKYSVPMPYFDSDPVTVYQELPHDFDTIKDTSAYWTYRAFYGCEVLETETDLTILDGVYAGKTAFEWSASTQKLNLYTYAGYLDLHPDLEFNLQDVYNAWPDTPRVVVLLASDKKVYIGPSYFQNP